MSKQVNRTLIGIFLLGAISLGLATIFLVAGGRFFKEQTRHLIYFAGEVQGLKVGAPVLFLGVGIGTVTEIKLELDEKNRNFLVPVTIEIEARTIRGPSGATLDLHSPQTIRQLVAQGLRAQLKTQSLLTGQLYVDLGFHQDKEANFLSHDPELSEIPTTPTQVEELTAMLKDFPMREFLADLTTISRSLTRLASSEQSKTIPLKLEGILANLESLSATLNNAANPLLTSLQTNLSELRQTLISVKTTTDQAGDIAGRLSALAREDSVISQTITTTGRQLESAAQAIRELTAEHSPTIQQLNTALQEISRLSRAMRLLAETLEQQPEAIIKGKGGSTDDHPH